MALPGYPDAAPLDGVIGGLLIGIAAAIMLLGLGRIAGISGITAKAFGQGGSGISEPGAWMFVIGLPLGALLVALAKGGLETHFASPVYLVIAGFLVGFGTRMGSGCTSGHGVCGVSRLAPRSIVATITFFSVGVVTVAVMNALGLEVLQ